MKKWFIYSIVLTCVFLFHAEANASFFRCYADPLYYESGYYYYGVSSYKWLAKNRAIAFCQAYERNHCLVWYCEHCDDYGLCFRSGTL